MTTNRHAWKLVSYAQVIFLFIISGISYANNRDLRAISISAASCVKDEGISNGGFLVSAGWSFSQK